MITDSGISPQSSVNDWSDEGERRRECWLVLVLVLAAADFNWAESSEVDGDRDKEGVMVVVEISCCSWAVSNDAGMLILAS